MMGAQWGARSGRLGERRSGLRPHGGIVGAWSMTSAWLPWWRSGQGEAELHGSGLIVRCIEIDQGVAPVVEAEGT